MAAGGRDEGRNLLKNHKNGTPVPNRIFVGGISTNTNEDDLRSFFSSFGNVKATKIIFDKNGISKGYGFVTFETDEEANNVLNEKACFSLNDRKLNIAAAFKKQPYGRDLDSSHNTSVVWPVQAYPSNTTGNSRESSYYPQASWPVMWPHQYYLQQQYYYPPTAHGGYPQYLYSIAPDCSYQSLGNLAGSDYSETSSADSGESSKLRSKASPLPLVSESERSRSTQGKQSLSQSSHRFMAGNAENAPNYMPSPLHHVQHPVFAKTLNGLTVMAYPSSIVMGSPIVHVKDGGNESENVLTELGFLHSAMSPNAMTPPPTPLSAVSCDINTSMESLRKN